MSGFANFAELAALVVDYAHRPDHQERCENIYIPFASLRIGRDLRSFQNESVAVLDGEALGDPMPVPADFGSIRSITPQKSRAKALKARDEIAITLLPTTGADAIYYSLHNSAITVRPFQGLKYDLSYHTVPVLTAANPTNNVLTRWPMLYLYASLVELHTWTQDEKARGTALATYLDEVRLVNRHQGRARQSAPQGVGV